MSESISIEHLAGQIQAYGKEAEAYQCYADELQRIFSQAFPQAVVQTRVKTLASFAEKALRKHDQYPDAVKMMTDLCGARIIVESLDQIPAVRAFIERNFDVLEMDDKSKSLAEDEFGYRDIHYIVRLRPDRDLGVSHNHLGTIGERKAEVQVRTVLQHAWAENLHDRTYKTAITVPAEWRRETNRLAALLEQADEGFSRIAQVFDFQMSAYDICLPKNKLEHEVAILQTVLPLVDRTQGQRRKIVILKLAKVLMALDRWEEAAKLLEKHQQDGDAELFLHLGYALCWAGKPEAGDTRLKRGLKRLTEIADPEQPAEPTNPHARDVVADKLGRGLRARALFLLGRTYALRLRRKEEAEICFQKAHALQPENPYYHLALVQTQLASVPNSVGRDLVASSLRLDIERCREHVALGVEYPNALLAIGRCHLLLGEPSACLCAYAKAIETALQPDTCMSPRLLVEEIHTVKTLSKLNPPLTEQVLTLLHLALWQSGKTAAARNERAKNPPLDPTTALLQAAAKRSLTWLKRQQSRDLTTNAPQPLRHGVKMPVLLIIGGAEDMQEQRQNPIKSYYDPLFEALEFFEGTVVCGGTTSGIPGIVGDVTRRLRERGQGRYELIAYLPEKLPADGQRHRSYTIVGRTRGANCFSEREVIACWRDLLLTGVPPEKIVAVGINGGQIARCEFRLALAFGAHLGVIQNSGRAAAELLADPQWRNHPNLCVLPEDGTVIWAFVNRYNNPYLTPAEVATAAPKAHEFYRQNRFARGETSDPSLKPWEALPPSLQNSNCDQIAFLGNILRKAGFRIVRSQSPPRLIYLTEQEVEKLARLEHARFWAERLSEGWKYGKPKNVEKKINPYLIAWENIPPNVKQYDYEAVRLFPSLLAAMGYEIQRIGK